MIGNEPIQRLLDRDNRKMILKEGLLSVRLCVLVEYRILKQRERSSGECVYIPSGLTRQVGGKNQPLLWGQTLRLVRILARGTS